MKELSRWVIIAILFFIPFQDLLSSLFYKIGIPYFLIVIGSILKEILIILLGTWFIIHNKGRIPKKIAFIYLMMGYVLILFILSSLPWGMKIAGLRQYLLLFVSLVAGYFYGQQNWKETITSRAFIIVAALYVISCYLQYFILPLEIFKDYFPILEMKRVALNLETNNEYFDTGLPVNYMGEAGERMLGPFNEPLYTAYFALPFFNYALWSYLDTKRKTSLVITLLFFLIIMLSQTRAVIIVAVIYFLLCIKNRINLRILSYLIIGVGVIVLANTAWLSSLLQSLLTTEGRSADHFLAYIIGVKMILSNLWGTGLGSGSAISSFMGGGDISLSVENAFINISLDLGVFVALLFLSTLAINYFKGERIGKMTGRSLPSPYNALILQFILMGFLAPHILTIRVIIPYMFIIGLAIKESQNESLHYYGNNNG